MAGMSKGVGNLLIAATLGGFVAAAYGYTLRAVGKPDEMDDAIKRHEAKK